MNCALESSIRRLASERMRIAASSACAMISRARRVRALLDLGGAAQRGGHRLRELVLLRAERLDLVRAPTELALELAVAVAQRLEVVVELAQRQAQLGERELDVLAAVAAAEPPVAERSGRWYLPACSSRVLLGRPTFWASSFRARFHEALRSRCTRRRPRLLPARTAAPRPQAALGPRPLTLSLELVLAAGLTLAVAGRADRRRRLRAARSRWPCSSSRRGVGLVAGWPVSGHAALGAAAAYLILETVFGRLDAVARLTASSSSPRASLGSVLAAGFARRRRGEGRSRKPTLKRAQPKPAADAAGRWTPGRTSRPAPKRLTAGTLEYEVERARRCERPLSVLASGRTSSTSSPPPAASSSRGCSTCSTRRSRARVRAIDVVGRAGAVTVPGRPPRDRPGGSADRRRADPAADRLDQARALPGRPVGVSVSIGVATYPADGADEVELDAAAERALARAAELGGNRTVLYSVPAGAPPGWGLSAAAGTRPPQPQRVTAAVAIWIPTSSAGRSCSAAKATSWAPKIATSTSANRVRASERKW